MIYQDDVYIFNPIKVLKDPPIIKIIESDENTPKYDLLDIFFIRVKIGTIWVIQTGPRQDIQGNVKKYVLPHVVTSTIHADQCETLVNMTIEFSQNNSNLILWDKGNLVVIYFQTKFSKYMISTVFYTIVSNKLFDWTRSILVLGLSWSMVVEVNW